MLNYKILVACDKESLFLSYNLLMQRYGEVETFLIQNENSFCQIDLNTYQIIILDISTKRYVGAMSKMKNFFEKSRKNIILISPFTTAQLKDFIDSLQVVNFVLTKPFEVGRLSIFIENELEKIKRKRMLEQKNSVLVEVIELHPSRIGVFDESGKLFYANYKYLNANELTRSNIDMITFDEVSQCNVGFEYIKNKLSVMQSFSIQKEERHKWYESIFYKIGESFVIHICTDITIAKQKEIQLEQSAVFYENSSEGILIADKKGKIVSTNKAFSKITGFTKDEAIGKSPSILKSGMHGKAFYENLWNSVNFNGSWKGEIWNRRKNGEIYPEWLSISKVHNPKYNEAFYIAIFTDITTLKEADKKLYFYANHDPLTSLPNRLQFEIQLNNAIESCKRKGTKIGVMFIDLDKFKDINDTYGHNIGDIMLVTVAKRLENTIRKEDVLARIGGDEFVVIAKDVSELSDLAVLSKKLLSVIAEPIKIEDKVFFMTLSIGISMFPDHGIVSEELIKNADVAMYEVKENGRNGYSVYNTVMTDKVTVKVKTQNELRHAIKHDQFVVHYQPVLDFATNKVISAEALIRWDKQNIGIVSPGEFLHFISEGDMNKDFGYLVFRKVMHDMAIMNSNLKCEDFKVAINIAPELFFDFGFAETLLGICNDFSILPTQIELELLETQIMKNPLIAQEKFNQLTQMGFDISLDDFGTGYSSLNYLKNFKVKKLKIDQSFVRDMLVSQSDNAIIKAIINLSQIFDMKVQAEGVETKEAYEVLKNYGCDYSQGYFHSKPLPFEKFIDFCLEHK